MSVMVIVVNDVGMMIATIGCGDETMIRGCYSMYKVNVMRGRTGVGGYTGVTAGRASV